MHLYHASASFLWKMSTHQVLHDAGVDSAENLTKAPTVSNSSKIFKRS
jgi:predicted heme/steroid binding protein